MRKCHLSELMCEVSFHCLLVPNTFKCKLESLLTLGHTNCWRNLWMLLFELVLSANKTERGINSILPIVSL